VPVVFTWLEEDAIAGPDDLDRAAAPLREPTPSSTQIFWPLGCACHAVRAPGVNWTLLVHKRDPAEGAATVSK
jgi:hypothetical protein